jgi:hypothetical protein
VWIEKQLNRAQKICELETQHLRVKLISELEKLFNKVKETVDSPHTDNTDDWIKVAAYIAQVINSLANSYDEVRLSEQMKELKELIEIAKKRAGKTQTGTPVA